MSNKLQLQVILSALDKATAPLKRIQGGSIGAAKGLKEARDKLKELNASQKDVSAWRTQRTAAAQTEQALSAAQQKVKELGRQMAATGVPTKSLNRDMKAAVREATQLKQQHNQQQTALQGLRNKLSAAGISTRNLGAGERDLRAKITATNAAMRQQEDRLKRITTQQKRLAAAKSQYEKSAGLAGSMAGSGAAGLATGGGMLYAGAKMMGPGAQFDEDMSKVQALTRLDGASEQLAELRAQARQLGAETMFSATDAAQGQAFLAMAGFTPEAIKAAMPGMLDVAKAGGMELAETADIASNVLSGMGLQASDMSRVADIMVGTFTRSNTSIAMLGETMKYVGPVAASVGQDIETVAAMAGKLGDAGIQGSMGGTALRSIINRLSAPPKAAAKALDELGISAKDADGNMRQMPDILTEIYKKTKDMGNADRAGLLKGIAGEEAVSALQVLVKQAGSGELQTFIGTLREAQGEAGKTAKIMGDNLVGDLDELSSAWEDLGIQLFEQQNGPMRGIVQTLADVVGGVKAWVVENPGLASGIIKTAAGLGVLIAAGGGITLVLGSILGPLAMVRYGMALFGIATSTALWPILAVIAAVVALAAAAYLIYKNWDKISAYFGSLWTEIKAGFDGGLMGILGLIVNFSPIGMFYRAFAAVMGYFGVELPGKFTEFGGMLMDGMVTGITNGLARVKDAITGAGGAAVGWFKEKLGIHSPSKVFAELGVHTMDGLAQGITTGQANPFAALDETSQQVIKKGAELSANNPFAALGEVTQQASKKRDGVNAGNPFAALDETSQQVIKKGAELSANNPFAALGEVTQQTSQKRDGVNAGNPFAGLAAIERPSIDRRPPISAGGGTAPAAAAGGPITINVYAAPGMDAAAVGQEVQRQLATAQRNQQARGRARLGDLE
jgi:TP901 family phage tail tape measure protein